MKKGSKKMKNVTRDAINSCGIRSEMEKNGIETAICHGTFYHPDQDHGDSSDWAITIYDVDGALVASTNGDPVWDGDAGFAILMDEYGIDM